jgi:hypothetical protein
MIKMHNKRLDVLLALASNFGTGSTLHFNTSPLELPHCDEVNGLSTGYPLWLSYDFGRHQDVQTPTEL